MTPTETECDRNIVKDKHKQRLVRSTYNDQLLDKSKNGVILRRFQVNPEDANDLYKIHNPAPAQWFSEWGVDGGEKRRIEICQSEAKTKKYGQLNLPAFLF